jgi:hypothetical protein
MPMKLKLRPGVGFATDLLNLYMNPMMSYAKHFFA